MVGDGNDIVAARDPWLISKKDFFVENSNVYEGKNEKVSGLFYRNSKFWDVTKVHQQFLVEELQRMLKQYWQLLFLRVVVVVELYGQIQPIDVILLKQVTVCGMLLILA